MEIERNCCPHGNTVFGDCPQCSPERYAASPLHGTGADVLTGRCCDNGLFGQPHACQKGTAAQEAKSPTNVFVSTSGHMDPRPGLHAEETQPCDRNGAGVPFGKLHQSPGRPRGARNLHAKHPSAISRAFKKAGLDWQTDFAEAIKANKTARIKLWLKLLPYLVTQRNHATTVKRWKGKASKAALVALQALEGKKQ